jgi:hypothetical protein
MVSDTGSTGLGLSGVKTSLTGGFRSSSEPSDWSGSHAHLCEIKGTGGFSRNSNDDHFGLIHDPPQS